MKITDIHSHILPGIDDGSRNSEMSLKMLSIMASSGVDVVCATPHFYGNRISAEHFLERRARSFNALQEAMGDKRSNYPDILLGAEVAFYSGLLKNNDIEKLCIGDTNTLLLEMPFIPWTDYEINQVADLCFNKKLNVIIAHIERYDDLAYDDMLERLLMLPVYVQINAESLLHLRGRRKLLGMFKDGSAKLLGSDAHNLDSRAPNLMEGRRVIERKLGADALDRIDRCAQELLKI